ncbi:MAG: hypothetical protein PVI60_12845, partial [Desulfobacteraceae bacterium]
MPSDTDTAATDDTEDQAADDTMPANGGMPSDTDTATTDDTADQTATDQTPPESDDDTTSNTGTNDISQYALSYAETADTYDPEDVLENITFDSIIEIDFSANTAG